MIRPYQTKSKIIVLSLAILLIALCLSLSILKVQTIQANKSNSELNAIGEGPNLQSEVYTIDGVYISRILPETTLRDLKNNLDEENITVSKTDGTVVQDTEFIGTGMKLIYGQKEYKLAVVGDLNGDGKAGITDLTQMKLSSVGLRAKPVNEYAKAGDINNDGKISITDLTKINLATVNLIDIIAPISFTPEAVSTKDTITILGETADSNSGVKEYWFEINNNGWVSNADKLNNKYTFEGLDMETKYTIRMKVVDNAGNVKITKRVEVETLNAENANISIVASTTEWTNQSILVAINFNSNVAREKKQVSIDDGNTWEDYVEPITVERNMTIKARVVNSRGEVLEEQEKAIENIDKLEPREFTMSINTTADSIIVGASTVDLEATSEYGESGIKEYEYTIVNGIWQSVYKTTENSYTFNQITSGVEYTIKVKAIDNAGNERIAKNSDGTEGEDGQKVKITSVDDLIEKNGGEIKIVPSTTEWTSQNITVTVEYPTIQGLVGEISLDNGIIWKEYTGAEIIQQNTIVKARMKDSTEQVSTPIELKITNIDKLSPKDFEMEEQVTTDSITVNVNAEDAEATETNGTSGIRGYQFKINDNNWTEVQKSGTYTFRNLTQGTNYTVKVRAIDNAGNITNANQDGSVDGKIIPTPRVDDEIEKTGKIQIKQNITEFTNSDVIIEVIYPEISGLRKEVKIGDEEWKTYTETFKVSKNTVIQARLIDSTGQTSTPVEKEITNIDKLAPNDFEISGTATTNSITINVGTASNPGTTDVEKNEEYACSGIKEYQYTIINGFWKWTETSTSVTHTFRNLMQGKKYKVIVTAVDNAGNETINDTLNNEGTGIQTNTTGEIRITADKTAWTKEDVKVTVTYPENTDELSKKISIDNGANWQDYTNNEIELTITENTVVRAKLMDGEEQVGKEINYPVNIIDKTPPKEFTISETVTSTSIEITANGAKDDESGIEGYYFSKDNGVNWVSNSSKLTNKYKFEGLTPATTYDMQIKVIDKVGNERIVTKQITTDAKYTLTIVPNGGTYSGSTTILQAEGTTVTISNPTRRGYNFSGWNLTGEGTLNGTIFTFGTGTATLTAEWEAINYTLTFDANGGTTDTSSITNHYGTSITLPSATRTYTVTYNVNGGSLSSTTATANYTFGGWYTLATGGTRAYYTTMPDENKILYAHWTGGSVTLPTPNSRTGYSFGGWYTDSACTTFAGNAGSSYTPTSNISLYAKWTKIQYTLTFLEADGGTASPSITRDAGSTVTLPTPTKSGYIFKGWYSNKNCYDQYKVADGGQYYTLDSNTTLYAKWIGEPIILYNRGNTNSSVTGGWSADSHATLNMMGNYMEFYGLININSSVPSRKYVKIEYSLEGSSSWFGVGYLHSSGGNRTVTDNYQNVGGGTASNPNIWTGYSGYGGRFSLEIANTTNSALMKIYSVTLYDELP